MQYDTPEHFLSEIKFLMQALKSVFRNLIRSLAYRCVCHLQLLFSSLHLSTWLQVAKTKTAA